MGEPPAVRAVFPATLFTPSVDAPSKLQYPTKPFVAIVPVETELTASDCGADGVVAGVVVAELARYVLVPAMLTAAIRK